MRISIANDLHAPLFSGLDFSNAGYSVLVRHGSPLLLLPPNRRVASLTLGLYLPQGRLARLAVASLGLFNSAGLLAQVLPRLSFAGGDPAAATGSMPFCQEDVASGKVGFLLCNPDHGCARVVAVRGGVPAGVFKWCERSGEAKLTTEITNLRTLWERKVRGVPVLRSEGRNDFSVWLELEHYPRAHVSTVRDSRVVRLLRSWMSEQSFCPLDLPLVETLWRSGAGRNGQERSSRLATLHVRGAVFHGDFAAWNLRTGPEGLVSVDWEWASPDGLAGVDLCYGLIQEAMLVRKLPAREVLCHVRAAAETPACREYLASAGWSGAIDLWIRLGVLYRNHRTPCPELLAEIDCGRSPHG